MTHTYCSRLDITTNMDRSTININRRFRTFYTRSTGYLFKNTENRNTFFLHHKKMNIFRRNDVYIRRKRYQTARPTAAAAVDHMMIMTNQIPHHLRRLQWLSELFSGLLVLKSILWIQVSPRADARAYVVRRNFLIFSLLEFTLPSINPDNQLCWGNSAPYIIDWLGRGSDDQPPPLRLTQ